MDEIERHTLSIDVTLQLKTLHAEFGEAGESIDDFASRAFRSAGLDMAATNGGELMSFLTVHPGKSKADGTQPER